jgi:uncharacterized membrane protein
MRKIFLSGLLACFLIGLLFFFFKFIVVDVLAALFRPLIIHMFDNESLVIPLSIVFSLAMFMVVGAIVTRIKYRDLFNKYLHKVPENLQKGRGALVLLGPDTYFLALIIKETTFMQANGVAEKYYVLYGPSTPLPWSGLPVLFAPKDKVRPLKLSYAEIYSMLGSFGGNTPDLLVEMKSRGLVDEKEEKA